MYSSKFRRFAAAAPALCFALCMCAPLAAQTEKYAEPVGEDQYGSVYEVKQSPTVLTAHLDENGEYVLPSFINSTVVRNQEEFYVLQQTPAPGTVFTCPQTVNVDIMDTSVVGEPDPWSTIVLELLDVTPPNVQLDLPASTTRHTSFGGVTRYVLPTAVIPELSITDACDAQPSMDVTLNGEPYQLGFPITEEGIYFLQATVTDASGNESFEQAVFEIRPRQSITAAAVVDNMQYEVDDTGQVATLDVSVLVGSADFTPDDIRLSSVRLMAAGPDGNWLPVPPVSIRDGFDDDCPIIDHELAAVDINDCYAKLEFRAELSAQLLSGPPAEVDLLGVGGPGGTLTFEWGARAPGARDPDPVNTLLGIIDKAEPCGAPEPPDPEPPLPCDAIETFLLNPTTCTVPWTPGPAGCKTGSGSSANATATTLVQGSSVSFADAPYLGACGPVSATCGTIPGTAMLLVRFVGDCCNCSVTYSGSGSVTADAEVGAGPIAFLANFTGLAGAGGFIQFTTPCATTVASATATVSYSTVPPVATPAVNPMRVRGISGPNTCTVPGCTSTMMIVNTGAFVNTSASAGSSSWCRAKAELTSFISGITAQTTFTNCPPDDGCEDPIDDNQP